MVELGRLPLHGRFCGCRCVALLASGGAFASVSSALHSPLLRDAGAAAATIAGAYNLVKVFDSLAQRGLVHQVRLPFDECLMCL
ncbi:hypothetical protein QJS10_CPA06g01894 [Acorus calamus]|uniref:Uncharacterized protein n=1 Tax=Acorus calamus TaxID=4465 RepID=A0AAV9EMV8_ACOCL|nr:hypothetical protein QJS10_CPA06g01894 [Acorus calamus]